MYLNRLLIITGIVIDCAGIAGGQGGPPAGQEGERRPRRRRHPKLRTEWYGTTWNYAEKICFKNQPKVNKCFGTEFRKFACILLHKLEFRVFLNSAEWFGMVFQEFIYVLIARNGILSIFLFRGKMEF
jgi:hypothetical protein